MKKAIRLIMVLLLAAMCITPVMALSFSDTGNHWAKEDINSLIAKGTVKGYTDGTFRPDISITRAEFTAILLRSMGNDPGNSPAGYWAERYIAEATAKGYIRQGDFDDVKANITRGEIARMMVNALTDVDYPPNLAEYARMIGDYGTIPSVFQVPILKAFTAGILRGRPDGTFGCSDTATRAEAVTMIMRFLDPARRVVPNLQATPVPTVTPTPRATPVVDNEVQKNPLAKALTEIDGYSSSAFDPYTKSYLIAFTEININNNGKADCTLAVAFPPSGSKFSTVAHVEVIRNTPTNLARFKKVIEVLLPDMSEELYTLAAERMAWKGQDFYGTFHESYDLYIGHLNSAVFKREEQGVVIDIVRK